MSQYCGYSTLNESFYLIMYNEAAGLLSTAEKVLVAYLVAYNHIILCYVYM